jgi:hypothetical protein
MDGVLCENVVPKRGKPFFKQNSTERKEYEKIRMNCLKTAPVKKDNIIFLKRFQNLVIITARKPIDGELTIKWLKENNFSKKIYFMTGGRTIKNMIDWKAKMINYFGISIYFEDGKEIVKGLEKKCKDCKIVFVDGDNWYTELDLSNVKMNTKSSWW